MDGTRMKITKYFPTGKTLVIESTDINAVGRVIVENPDTKFCKVLYAEGCTVCDRVKVVRCKDCRYRNEIVKEVPTMWLPCMAVETGDNWYCGWGEKA